MPAPAVLGIPLIAAILGTVFTKVFEFVAKYFTKKVAIVAAAIVVVVGVTGVFIAAIEGLIAGVAVSMPTMGNWVLFMPGNISACVSAIVTARLLRWAYDWNIKILQWKLF